LVWVGAVVVPAERNENICMRLYVKLEAKNLCGCSK